MKNRLLSALFIMSLCSCMLIGCGASTPADEPASTEASITVEPEATPTPEAEPEATEETKEPEATETVEPEVEPTEEPQAEETETNESPAYTFTDMDAIKYAKSSVNVRSLPDTSGDKLGGLSTNDEVHITGQCNETGWYRFEYNGSIAYVSNSYLVDEKITVSQPSNDSNNNSNGNSNSNSDNIIWGDGERTYANAKSYFASIGYPICTVFWNGDGTFSFYELSGQANANGDNVYDCYDMLAANGIHGFTGTGPGQDLGVWTINGGKYSLGYITATPNSLD